MKEKPFKTEADLCAAFIEWAKREGWTVYPETAGWDILLVDKEGRQLGIEAKLSMNWKVLEQTIKSASWLGWGGTDRGPDHRAVLVPEVTEAQAFIMATIGLGWFVPSQNYGRSDLRWTFDRRTHLHEFGLFDWNPAKREALPDFVPDVPAGVPSPRTLSPWKVGALRVLARLEIQGFLVREDVRECKNDPRRWCASDGWLVQLGQGRWGRCDRTPAFNAQHPDVYPKVLAEERAKIALKGMAA